MTGVELLDVDGGAVTEDDVASVVAVVDSGPVDATDVAVVDGADVDTATVVTGEDSVNSGPSASNVVEVGPETVDTGEPDRESAGVAAPLKDSVCNANESGMALEGMAAVSAEAASAADSA